MFNYKGEIFKGKLRSDIAGRVFIGGSSLDSKVRKISLCKENRDVIIQITPIKNSEFGYIQVPNQNEGYIFGIVKKSYWRSNKKLDIDEKIDLPNIPKMEKIAPCTYYFSCSELEAQSMLSEIGICKLN
jgi:hypothetical protein